MTLAPPGNWRAMAAQDMPQVYRLGTQIHPSFPEDEAVFAERLGLFPQGCFVLQAAERLQGYVISHPYAAARMPKLNALLGALPDDAAVFYIHDLALSGEVRGLRQGAAIVHHLERIAERLGFAKMALVAVNNSARFWQARGFGTVQDAALAQCLQSYGDDAIYMTRLLSAVGALKNH